ncbi:glycerate kinase [Actinoplanes sp. NBRC 101535]|uniref:glycerate kinase n=1 Tax=Actinoplanes sp. NBRC 101535 TaxID=3032196 RepID=UPI0024A477F8|nr:glycerate kinase [Actinoplanes sp. NBRC 101535]GLY08517.1 glycerate kinase [Actinoplanes sp. NBRC 101535]
MRVLIAPDKFKGSLTAAEVAAAIRGGLESTGVHSRSLPLADGGDGSVAAALHAGFTAHPVTARGADGCPVHTTFASDGTTAIVEIAGTCGLATLDAATRHPMAASSHGLGQAVAAAVATGATTVVLALGGSASTDGGSGMLAALGARFYDVTGSPVDPSGATLAAIASADLTGLIDLTGVDLVVATDVTNALLGPDGAAAVFAPQKGADEHQVRLLEDGLAHFARTLARLWVTIAEPEPSLTPGAGAAGGVGFAALMLGARRVSGAEYLLDLLGFDDELARCDAVVIGEGSMDAQTLWGKLPAVIAARAAGKPVYAVAGRSSLTADERRHLGIRELWSLTDMTDGDPSRDPALSLRLATRAGTDIGHRLRAPA